MLCWLCFRKILAPYFQLAVEKLTTYSKLVLRFWKHVTTKHVTLTFHHFVHAVINTVESSD